MRPCYVLLLAGCAVLPEAVHALEWKQTRIELRAESCATEADAVFVCHNPLDRPVRILDVETSCGCTSVHLETREIPPHGESHLLVVFHFGGRQGPQEKSIYVTADDASSPARLVLAVELPVVVHLQPAALSWRPGERRSWKACAITLAPDDCLALEGIEVGSQAFAARLVRRGSRREIRVRPLVAEPVSSFVLIHVRVGPTGERRSFQLAVASGLTAEFGQP